VPQIKKKRIDRYTDKTTSPEPATGQSKRTRRSYIIIAAVFVAVILLIVGVFYYQEYVAPFNRTIITVDDTDIKMDYFLSKARLTGIDPLNLLEPIINEQIIKQEAPRYVGNVSPPDIDQELRRTARGASDSLTESEFEEWYRQQLNETRLSDAEFKEMIRTGILAQRLQEYLAERAPTMAEQVHLNAILLENYEKAAAVKKRWESGEDFATLAREVSQDKESAKNGGDIGWYPRGVLNYGLDEVAFNLEIGTVSEPVPSEVGFHLIMVSEKAAVRKIDEEKLQVLKDEALTTWLQKERQYHKIEYSFNSEIYAWINQQLAKKPS